MGFTTGFIGGLTATYTLLYLSLHLHRTNRIHQSTLLNQQRSVLSSLYDPQPAPAELPAYEIRKAGITEELKDRWNREVETAVRNLQETDWEDVRVRWEGRIAQAWERVKGLEAVEKVEERVKERFVVTESVEESVKKAAGEKRLLELK